MSQNLLKRLITSIVLLLLLIFIIFSHQNIFILSILLLGLLICFEANKLFTKLLNNMASKKLSPTNKLNIKSAINQAGGYQQYADKRRVYVIKANGIVEKANRNIFVRNIDIEPGDTIVVPRKIITNNPGIEALIPITQILSDLAFSAAALDNLSNN